MSLSPGSTLGPYAIRAKLGHGGMGVVYTAHGPRLKRQVTIKLLTADLTRDETAGGGRSLTLAFGTEAIMRDGRRSYA